MVSTETIAQHAVPEWKTRVGMPAYWKTRRPSASATHTFCVGPRRPPSFHSQCAREIGRPKTLP